MSLANLPQLAVDLFIHTLELELTGYIGTGETVAPLIGTSKAGLVTGGLECELRYLQAGDHSSRCTQRMELTLWSSSNGRRTSKSVSGPYRPELFNSY